MNFINPAYEQVMYIEKLMKENNIKGNTKDSTFEIYTTGTVDTYEKMIKVLSIDSPDKIEIVEKAKGF